MQRKKEEGVSLESKQINPPALTIVTQPVESSEGVKLKTATSSWAARWVKPNITGFLMTSAMNFYIPQIPGLPELFMQMPMWVGDVMGASGSSLMVRMGRPEDDVRQIPVAAKVLAHLGMAAAVGCTYRVILDSVTEAPAPDDVGLFALTAAVQSVVTATAQKAAEVGIEYLATKGLFKRSKSRRSDDIDQQVLLGETQYVRLPSPSGAGSLQ